MRTHARLNPSNDEEVVNVGGKGRSDKGDVIVEAILTVEGITTRNHNLFAEWRVIEVESDVLPHVI